MNVSGGFFEEEFIAGGEVNITGGNLGPDFATDDGSVVNFSGGTFGDGVFFGSGSEVNLIGFGFLIDGLSAVPVIEGQNFANQAQGAVLSGTFADGTPFSFDFSDSDFLSSTATLTLTIRTNNLGDFNGDGDVDIDDINSYAGNIGLAATGSLSQLDLTNDGQITLADLQTHVESFVQTSNGETRTFLGDLNLDGSVDVLGDAFALVGNLGGSATSYAQGDINLDGTVDVLGDAFLLIGNLSKTNVSN